MTQLKRLLLPLAFLVCMVFPQSSAAADDPLRVVATLGDLGAIAEEVGGSHVTVDTLANPHEDPHFVDAKPSYLKSVARADLVVLNGMSLEIGWLPTLIDNSRNGAVQKGESGYFDASYHIERKGVPQGEVTRAMGDVHPEGNPHYTFAPRQMARVALALGKRLAELEPAHADTFKKNARSIAKECLRVAKKWESKFNSLDGAGRNVVVYHEAWIYLTDWLDLEAVAAIEPKPGVDPNPKHVASVVETMKSQNVRAMIHMEYYPSAVIDSIAKKTGATRVQIAGQAESDQDYIARVNALASSIYEALTAGNR
jgi:zinc/manganese transport system substrate-binding protein